MDYTSSEHLIRVFDFGILHMEVNTIVFIVVLTLVLLYLLNRLLFRPVLRTLDNRARHLAELRERAETLQEEVKSLQADYETRLAQVRAEVAEVRAQARADAQKRVDEILSEARRQADTEFQTALDDLMREMASTREQLGASASHLAEDAVKQVLPA